MTGEQREELIRYVKHHERAVKKYRFQLEEERKKWAAETKPTFSQWMTFVGDDPQSVGSHHFACWMGETGRKMQ